MLANAESRPAIDIDAEPDAVDGNAEQSRRLVVAADGVNPAAHDQLPQAEFNRRRQDQAEKRVVRHAGNEAAAVQEIEVGIEQRDGVAVGDNEGEARRRPHR